MRTLSSGSTKISEGKDKAMSQGRKHPASARLGVETMIREDILQKFPELFGTKTINGREVHVEQAIAELARELGPAIAAALTARRALLRSPAPVREKYAWPQWDDTFEDPVTAQSRTCREMLQYGIVESVCVVLHGRFVVERASRTDHPKEH